MQKQEEIREVKEAIAAIKQWQEQYEAHPDLLRIINEGVLEEFQEALK